MGAIWLHQFDRIPVAHRSVNAIMDRWPGEVYVKALDGPALMDNFDSNRLAVSSTWGGGGWQFDKLWVPWTVPICRNVGMAEVEGQLSAELLTRSGRIILDLEPYEGFYRGGDAETAAFMRELLKGDGQIDLSVDYRRLADGFPPEVFINHSTRMLPQCYWTTFRRPWQTVLEEAYQAMAWLEYLPPEMEFVLPADASLEDLEAAIQWCEQHSAKWSIWLWQTMDNNKWDLAHYYDEEAAFEPTEYPTYEDLQSLVGYLQYDVANRIEAAVKRPNKAFRAALAELRNAGK